MQLIGSFINFYLRITFEIISELTSSLIIGTDWIACHRGYDMIHDLWNMRLRVYLRILVKVDADEEFVSPNGN